MRRYAVPICALALTASLGALTESRIGRQSRAASTASQVPRLTVEELFGTYQGAMQMPPSPGGVAAEYGYPPKGIAFNPANSSLFVPGTDVHRTLAELDLVLPSSRPL